MKCKEINRTIQSEIQQQSETLLKALGEQPVRQPVAVDAGEVADRLLGLLTDSDSARSLFSRMMESYHGGREEKLGQMLYDLPCLFDAIDQPLEYWDVGSKLTETDRQSREIVLAVLQGIRKKFDAWRLRHQVDRLPDPSDLPCAYDQGLHQRVETVATNDAQLYGTIERVIQPGYLWNGERLRKAEVTVWGPGVTESDTPSPSLPGNVVADSTPVAKQREANDDHERS
ncbi:hypothetical protein BH23PLA1_BH23PLA1_35580 [soil metagenome]